MLLQLAFVLIAIIIGARIGGIGLGVLGGLGLGILTFGFGLQPTSPPIDVMLMIVAVIAAASCMQAAGGLDLMVKWAEKLLRKNPQRITILSPLVTYLFTFIAERGMWLFGLSGIAEVATETKIRPERPDGDRRDRFPAGHYGQSDIGGYGSFIKYVVRIQYLLDEYLDDLCSLYLIRCVSGSDLLFKGR